MTSLRLVGWLECSTIPKISSHRQDVQTHLSSSCVLSRSLSFCDETIRQPRSTWCQSFLVKKQQPNLVRKSVKASIAVDEPGTAERSKEDVPPGSVSVVLLSGGTGKRMGASMPKQYMPLLNMPIVLHSLYKFAELPEVGEIVIVCDPSWRHMFEAARDIAGVPFSFALPGKERQDSVFSGLQAIRADAMLVAVHDSARPLIKADDFRKVLRDALKHGAAVLGVPVKATIKEAGTDRFVTKTLDRKMLWEMQTPQVIQPDLLRRGFEHVQRESLEVTDDVSIVEYLEHPVCITPGCYTNLKITTPDDLLLAERILHQWEEAATK